jgi:hypothetical protein
MKRMRDLIDPLGSERGPIRYRGRFLSPGSINVLLQTRRTFEGIEELSLDIAKKGLLHPITVACFNRETCEKYLVFINRLWGTSYDLASLAVSQEKGKDVYFVLLAGERRFRALKLTWEKGCIECRERFGVEKEGKCFKRHFRRSVIEVRLCSVTSPMSALFIQLSENTHMRVPPHEEAHAYKQLFMLIRERHASFSLARFAREVGRSPSFIKSALLFCGLPVWAQKVVENNPKLWGKGLVLARLYEKVKNEDDLRYWTMIALVGKHKVGEFSSLVGKYLDERVNGQRSLMEIFGEEADKLAKKRHIRYTVEQGVVQSLWQSIAYVRRVIDLFERGMLGMEYSPFSERSPVKVFRGLVDRLEAVLPHLAKFLPKKYIPIAQEDIRKAKEVTDILLGQEKV